MVLSNRCFSTANSRFWSVFSSSCHAMASHLLLGPHQWRQIAHITFICCFASISLFRHEWFAHFERGSDLCSVRSAVVDISASWRTRIFTPCLNRSPYTLCVVLFMERSDGGLPFCLCLGFSLAYSTHIFGSSVAQDIFHFSWDLSLAAAQSFLLEQKVLV